MAPTLLHPSAHSASPLTFPVTVHLPQPLWEGLRLCIPDGMDVNAVICEAVEAYLARSVAQGKKDPRIARLVVLLSQPITALGLSARAEHALLDWNIQYVHDLVRKTRRGLYPVKNLGPKSLQDVQDKLAALGLSLGMALDAATYRAAVVHAHLTAHRALGEGGEG